MQLSTRPMAPSAAASWRCLPPPGRLLPCPLPSRLAGSPSAPQHCRFQPAGGAARRSTVAAGSKDDDGWETWEDTPGSEYTLYEEKPVAAAAGNGAGSVQLSTAPDWNEELVSLAQTLRGEASAELEAAQAMNITEGSLLPKERAFLVGAALKSAQRPGQTSYGILESLEELGRLADTAGLEVVGHTHQLLDEPNARTYVGTGKVSEIKAAVERTGAETVIFDDELSPGQLRNLERALGGAVRLCDRTALILDIFSQRAGTREGKLQVELAQVEYQLPRLTRMWSHLERQAGGAAGRTKGMGEKQIEVDRRLLRERAAKLRRSIEDVRTHRRAYRDRRAAAPIPVIALAGYTNAGKSSLLNALTNAGVLAEDQLFATLDPTTRRISLPAGQEALMTDTVGFIQKLPTQLVAAFRATLEEIRDASLLLHVVDASHPHAGAQVDAVNKVLKELDATNLPTLTVWNKVDLCADAAAVRAVAKVRGSTACVSALTGDGLPELLAALAGKLQDAMVPIEAVIPYSQGDLVDEVHRSGVVDSTEYEADGTLIKAHVPPGLAGRLRPLRVDAAALALDAEDEAVAAAAEGFMADGGFEGEGSGDSSGESSEEGAAELARWQTRDSHVVQYE